MAELGTFGVWTSTRVLGEDAAPGAAALAESLGFGTMWIGGSPRLPALAPLLEATASITLATGVANIWQYKAGELAADYARLAPDHRERLLVGIGAGHPEHTGEYERPLTTMRGYLDALDQAPTPVPASARALAALAPRMLELSAQRARGTHPYFVPVEHTRIARAQLGPGPLIAPELACVLDEDRERARASAREYAGPYLGLRNYTNNILRCGYEPADVADGGSDRLLDAVVPQGSAATIAELARAHIEAGADHVCVQVVGVRGVPSEQWAALARELLG